MWKKRHPCKSQPQPKVIGKLGNSLELPLELLEKLPSLELQGNREAVVEHCDGVLSYDDKQIRIQAGELILEFNGRNLKLCCMTDESIVITGYFTGLGFRKQGG